ncbi:MAG: DUF1292 domain-containing protein [Christensenellaceae bacterium]|nr:DUF1292 domain-containing protein [Christensenellaceae bacterium]
MYNEDQTHAVNRSANSTADSQEFFEGDNFIKGFDEDGNLIKLQVIRYFFYNGEEYVVLGEALEAEELEEANDSEETEIDAYIMKVDVELDEDNEELEVFSPIEDDELLEKLTHIALNKFTEVE